MLAMTKSGNAELDVADAGFDGLTTLDRTGALAPIDCNRPVILPISSRRPKSIIAGTHIMGAAFVANMSSGASAAMSFTLR